MGVFPLSISDWVLSMGFSMTGLIMAALSMLMKENIRIMLTKDQVRRTVFPDNEDMPLFIFSRLNHLGKSSELSILNVKYSLKGIKVKINRF